MGRINWPGIRKAERVFIICVLLLTTIAGAAGSKAAAAAASLKPSFESAWGIGEAGFLENSIRSLVVDPKEGYNEYYAIADLDNGSSLGLTFAADKGTSNPAYIVKLSDQGGALHQVWIKGIYAAENSSDIPLGGASKDYRIRLNSLAILKDGSLVAVGTGVPYDPIGSLMEGMNYQITLQDFSGNKAAYKHSISKNSVTNYTGIASDGLMVKLNPDGELQGASAIGTKIATSIGGDIALSQVQPTSDGGYVAIGYSRGVSGYFGPIGNRMEPFVIKYNAAGTNEWITHFYEKRSNIANLTTELLSVTELPGGGYAVAGWSSAKSFSRIYKNGAIYKDAASVDISFPLNNDSSQHKGLIGVLSADGTLQGITTYAPEGAEIADLNDIAASEDGSSLLAVGRAVTGGVPAAFSVKFKTGDLSVEAEKGYSQTSDPLLKDSTADNPENLTTIIPLGDGNYWLGGIANGLAEASAGKTPAGGSAKGGQDIVVIHSDENLNTGWVYLAGGTRNEASFKGAGYEGTLSMPVIAAAGNGLVVYGATQSADGEAAVLGGRSPVSGADGGYNAFVARYGLINPDQVAADAAAQIIGALPETEELTLADKAAVTVAREVYGSLTAPQQALVSAGTLDKLTAAEAKITALEEAKAKVDRESAWQVTYKINNLPSPVALADKAAGTA
ncbi:hypothetical protein, partial [Paenibacillus forsythiae]|uniref:hypothetical protein n=1 Tax=Paenibacillus forsythiae TaxID=365616 RepID=UPI0005637ED3